MLHGWIGGVSSRYPKTSRIIVCDEIVEHEGETKRGGKLSNLEEPVLLRAC